MNEEGEALDQDNRLWLPDSRLSTSHSSTLAEVNWEEKGVRLQIKRRVRLVLTSLPPFLLCPFKASTYCYSFSGPEAIASCCADNLMIICDGCIPLRPGAKWTSSSPQVVVTGVMHLSTVTPVLPPPWTSSGTGANLVSFRYPCLSLRVVGRLWWETGKDWLNLKSLCT